MKWNISEQTKPHQPFGFMGEKAQKSTEQFRWSLNGTARAAPCEGSPSPTRKRVARCAGWKRHIPRTVTAAPRSFLCLPTCVTLHHLLPQHHRKAAGPCLKLSLQRAWQRAKSRTMKHSQLNSGAFRKQEKGMAGRKEISPNAREREYEQLV